MDTLWQDLRHGARLLRKRPGFAATVVLILAVGIGVNTAMFTVIRGVLLRPLPFPEPNRIVLAPLSYADFRDVETGARSFEELAVYGTNVYNLAGRAGNEQVRGAIVTPEFFSVLGVPPLVGRTFRPGEDEPVVVLGHDLWQRRFGGDAGLLGTPVALSGSIHTIVGVMPPQFTFPPNARAVWVSFGSALARTPEQAENRQLRIFRAVGRLRPEATLEQANAEAATVSQRLALQFPDTNRDIVTRFEPLHEVLTGHARPALRVLAAGVGFVLLIACANVANLFLARGASRRREMALRTALGARRARLVRQLLTESLMVAALGGVVGLAVAEWGTKALTSLEAGSLPRLESIRVDGTVLGFTLLTAMVAGLLCGVAPALSATRVDPNGQLKEGERNLGGGRRGRRMRSALVVAEVSMAMVLLAGAGLMVKSFVRLMRVDAGLDPAHVLTLNVLPPLEKYPDPWRRAEMFRRVHAALARVPGVAASAGATAMPPDVLQRVTAFEVEGMPELPPSERFADFVAATPDWFRVLGVPMAAGRAFTERDGRDAPPVVIINESLARRLFPRGEAVGRQLRLRNSEHAPDLRTIVGVAGEVRYRGLDAPARSSLYTPFDQTPWFGQYVLVRTRSAPEGLAGAIERAVAAVDPDLFTAAVMPLDRVVSRSVATPRFQLLLLATFAALALGLAAIGIYGVLAYQVAERSHEFGIRMALGARRGDLFRLVLRWGMWLAVLGMALGAGGALALTRFLAGLLFEVRPTDPLTFALVAALMGGVALSACCLPARRATLGDPVSALHHE